MAQHQKWLYCSVSDVRTDMHSDTEEVEGVTSDRESKGHGARGESPRESVDSPDNIDVVSFYHTPPRPSTQSPKTSCTPPAPDSPSCNGFKVKREDEGSHLGNNSDSGHHGGDHSNSSSCQGDNPATQGLVRHLQLPSDVLYLKVSGSFAFACPDLTLLLLLLLLLSLLL